MNNKNLGKIFIGMGLITLITTLIDYFALVFPSNLSNPQWVFSVTQSISDLSIMPALAMVFLLTGFFFAKEASNENLFKNLEKVTGLLSLTFAVGFAGCALMYALSAGGVENSIVESLKTTNNNTKQQLNQYYELNKAKIDAQKYEEYVEKMDEQMMLKVNQANSSIQKSTFKTMLTLLFFSALQLYIFIKIFELLDFIKYKVFKLKRKSVNQ